MLVVVIQLVEGVNQFAVQRSDQLRFGGGGSGGGGSGGRGSDGGGGGSIGGGSVPRPSWRRSPLSPPLLSKV